MSERRDHPTRGILTFVANLVLMAIISALVKTLVLQYPLGEILLFRFIAAMVFFWVLLLYTSGFSGLSTTRPLDHVIRSTMGISSLALFYFAISSIPIADATAIAYAAPIFVTLLSIFILGESIKLRRWVAVICGFIGVLLIARPGVTMSAGMLAAIGSALTGALVAIWLRRLSSSEKSVTIGLFYNSAGTLGLLLWVLVSGWVTPQGGDQLIFLGFGVLCALQQWLLTISFRYAEASLLAPFEYLAMVFAAIVGYVFWGEVPLLTTWLGAAVIASSGIFIFLRRQQNAQPVDMTKI